MSAPEKKFKDSAKSWQAGFKKKKRLSWYDNIRGIRGTTTRKGWESKGAK
jgi:hypothetical protein